MNWTDIAVIMFLLVILCVQGAVGSHFGYTVNGIPQAGAISEQAPGILGALGWIWDSMKFLFDMLLFRIDNMPPLFSYVNIIIILIIIFIVLKLIRGTG